MKDQNRNVTARCLLPLSAALGLLTGLPSCASNEELQTRLDRRDETSSRYQDRRKIHSNAMDERYNARFDRVMD